MRLLVFIFCLLCLAPFTHADCEIASVSFAPSQAHIREGVPFFPGTGQSGVQRHLIIKTNNDPACSNTSVYPVVFSSHARDRASTDPDIPLDNINGTKEFRILPLGNIAGQTEYGLSITLQTAEEKCYGHGYDDLKKLVKESIANGTGRQSDYDYLKSDPKNAPLYGFLFDDPASITTTTIPDTTTSVEGYVVSEYTAWTAKQIIYKKFNKADCGYYARAKLGTAFTPAELNERSIAQQQSADYTTGNSVFYMCSVSDYQYDLDREDQEVSDAISWSLFLPKQGVWGSIKGIFTGGNLRLLIEDIIDTGTARISRQTLENNFCEDNLHKWEVRNATANFNPGSADNNDPCVDGDQVIPGCYELLAPIPTLGRTVNFDGSTTEQPFALEQFFLSMINILIGAVSIMAVGALIYLGFMYMNARSFGNIPNLKKYKTRFIQVFYGIGIILSSYIILNTINPELLRLVPALEEVEFEGDPDAAPGAVLSGGTAAVGRFKLPSISTSLGIICPGNGGVNNIYTIANSFKGKATYRYGAKGMPPETKPYPDYKVCDGKRCGTFCPDGTICTDCSGFVNHVLQCAGMKTIPGYQNSTAAFSGPNGVGVNSNAIQIKSLSSDGTNVVINGTITLIPGDILGKGGKHVIVYIGKGKIAHSTAGKDGRKKNNNIQIEDLTERFWKKNSGWLQYMRKASTL